MTSIATVSDSTGEPRAPSLSDQYARLQAKQPAAKPYSLVQEPYASLMVTLTVIIMAYSNLVSTLPILALYAIWFPQICFRGLKILRPSADFLLTMAFPAYCCFSVIWSDYRDITTRLGLEFASMLICVIIMARIVSMKSLLKGIILGTALALIATIIDGTYGTDYFSGTYSLVGLFGSKNEVGFVAEISILTALMIFTVPGSRLEKMLYSLLPSLLALVALYKSKSATAVVTLVIVITVLAIMYGVTRFPVRARPGIALIFFVGLLILSAIAASIGMEGTVLNELGKDTTLTGRTYLWGEGWKIALSEPFLGHGYAAFWVPGQPQAERYWYEFGIIGKTGFHFHNLYIQSFVDLGIVGLCLISFFIIRGFWLSLRGIMRNGMKAELVFSLAFSALFMIRACVEVDFLGPFGMGTMLFFLIFPLLATYRYKKSKRQESQIVYRNLINSVVATNRKNIVTG